MYYYRRPPRKRVRHYIMPFATMIVIIGLIAFGWQSLNRIFIEGSKSTTNERVFLDIEKGSVKAMATDSNEWKNVPDKIYLYKGEKIKTGGDGRASITFFEESVIRLDENSEIEFETLKRKKDIKWVDTNFKEGRFWAKIQTITNPESYFNLSTDQLQVKSKGGVIAIDAPNTVYILEGSAQVDLQKNGELIKSYTLGVGQQFMVNENDLQKIQDGQEVDVIFALSDGFKKSNWYRWNQNKDNEGVSKPLTEDELEGEEIDSENSEETIDADETEGTNQAVSILSPKSGSATQKSTIDISGEYNVNEVTAVFIQGKKATISTLGQWTAYEVSLGNEGKNTLSVEMETLDGQRVTLDSFIIHYDSTKPTTPVISEPGENGQEVTLEEAEVMIKGTVEKGTAAVIVNDYQLSKFTEGDENFEYYAKATFGNLKVGENLYEIYAKDKAGNLSEPATITLIIDEETIKKGEEESSNTEEGQSSGGVQINEPNGGKSFTTSKTEFELKGVAPEGAAKVVVNDYTLSKFQKGDTVWSYKAYSSMGSLKIGSKNTYKIEAYDENGELMGQASMTIDVESEGAPEITIPTNRSSYLTTLDELVIGGPVGKWVQNVYVNDEKLLNYIPGNEKWHHTIKLKTGVNNFKVEGEKDGVKTGSDEIEITYQP